MYRTPTNGDPTSPEPDTPMSHYSARLHAPLDPIGSANDLDQASTALDRPFSPVSGSEGAGSSAQNGYPSSSAGARIMGETTAEGSSARITGSSATTSGMGESETRLRGHAKGKGSESGMGGLGLASRRGESMPKLSLKRLVSSSEEVKGLAKRGVRLGEWSATRFLAGPPTPRWTVNRK